jgi:hypothetical protein
LIEKPRGFDLFFILFYMQHAELQDPDPKLFGNAGCGSVYNAFRSATLM